MKIKVEVEAYGCDFCGKHVSNGSYCEWCHKYCCVEHGQTVTVRDSVTHAPVACATRWVCEECAKTVYSQVIEFELEISKLEHKLRELKRHSHDEMSGILQSTIEKHRNEM